MEAQQRLNGVTLKKILSSSSAHGGAVVAREFCQTIGKKRRGERRLKREILCDPIFKQNVIARSKKSNAILTGYIFLFQNQNKRV
jgi:hypothetical protein